MSSKHLLALVAVALWTAAGCASILGVDSSDYADAAAILCTCPGAPDNCAATVEARIADEPDLEQLVLDCMSVDPACREVTACVADAGYCAREGAACAASATAVLGCCDGLSCISAKCCGAGGYACVGENDCCSKQCVDGACLACAPVNDPCEADTDCCSGSCGDGKKCRPLGGG